MQPRSLRCGRAWLASAPGVWRCARPCQRCPTLYQLARDQSARKLRADCQSTSFPKLTSHCAQELASQMRGTPTPAVAACAELITGTLLAVEAGGAVSEAAARAVPALFRPPTLAAAFAHLRARALLQGCVLSSPHRTASVCRLSTPL